MTCLLSRIIFLTLEFMSNKADSRSRIYNAPEEVNPVVTRYKGIHETELEERQNNYKFLVNDYYDLATDFFEWGWGKSFHFAPRRRGESFKESLLRHQRNIASQLSLQPGMQVLDAGCGVGGPMGNLARWSGASFVGVNINQYQIERAKKHTRDVSELCRFLHTSYMQIPEENDRYDAAFAIESTIHAPDRTGAFREICRVLRPGAYFAGYEWALTDDFDTGNSEHRHIKQDIMLGNGLPDINFTHEIRNALRDAGFEILETRDMAADADPETPWYRALQGRDFTLASIPRTPIGRSLTNLTLQVGEWLRLVPKGSRAFSTFLNTGADALVKGGEFGVFTPMFFFLARKPEQT